MFDIGFWELLVIGIVALVVLGPERLPSAIRSTVKTVRGIKSAVNGVKQEVSQQLKVHELHEHLKQAEAHGLDAVPEEVKRSVAELKAAAQSVQQPYADNTQHNERLNDGRCDKPSSPANPADSDSDNNTATSSVDNKNDTPK